MRQETDDMASGTKHDGGKPRPSLVLGTMARAIRAVIAVAEHGAKKYSADNWLLVPDGVNRYTDAMLRHLVAEHTGEAKDPDSGLLHAAHAAWGALARLDLMLRKAERNPAAGVPPSHAVDAMRYQFSEYMMPEHVAAVRHFTTGVRPPDPIREAVAELRDKQDAMRGMHAAGLLNTAFKAQAELNAAASLKLDEVLRRISPAAHIIDAKGSPELWSTQLVRWLRHYSKTFARYEAEGLLRAEYASNVESLRVVGVKGRRYDGVLAVIPRLPRDGSAVGGVEALGLAVDRAVAHWDELAKRSATKLGGIDWAKPAGFADWAQQVEAKVRAGTVALETAITVEEWQRRTREAGLFTKLRALSPLFTRLEAARQLVAAYDPAGQLLTVKGVNGGLYDGFNIGMRNVNPGALNLDASMRSLAKTLEQEIFAIDQRRVNQAQRDFEKRKAELAERERREKAQAAEAMLHRHHLAETNPVRICRAKLKHILSMASLPVTRRLEQLRRADRLRVELQGCELRLTVCDPNGAELICLHQIVDLNRPRLHALEDATVAAYNRLLAIPRLESLVTPTKTAGGFR